MTLTYSIITPARDEAAALPRLAEVLDRQTVLPTQWIIAENGSIDSTRSTALSIAAKHDWVRVLAMADAEPRERGAPIVRAIHAGLEALDGQPDVVVNVDADVTMNPDYFERLLEAFERNPSLGIASGSAWESSNGIWRQRFVTGGTVWGAVRAYRWECLQSVLPLEARHGWDGIDQLKARARGWDTKVFADLPFRHHRGEGSHEASSWAHWRMNGDTAYFMGYQPWYLIARALHQLRRDRSALALIVGYLSAAMRRSPRLDDPQARAVLRRDQSVRSILRRRREALGAEMETLG